MYCKYCGVILDDTSKFCSSCGKIVKTESVCENQSDSQPNYQTYQIDGKTVSQAPQHTIHQSKLQAKLMPMKWFNFLIYFALFAGAILNMLTGIAYLTGGYNAEYYQYIENLRLLDAVNGICCIAVGVFQIYVRYRLSNYRTNGPQMLILVYICGYSISVLYILGVHLTASTQDIFQVFSETLTEVVSCSLLVFLNYDYFKKRAHLFVN